MPEKDRRLHTLGTLVLGGALGVGAYVGISSYLDRTPNFQPPHSGYRVLFNKGDLSKPLDPNNEIACYTGTPQEGKGSNGQEVVVFTRERTWDPSLDVGSLGYPTYPGFGVCYGADWSKGWTEEVMGLASYPGNKPINLIREGAAFATPFEIDANRITVINGAPQGTK